MSRLSEKLNAVNTSSSAGGDGVSQKKRVTRVQKYMDGWTYEDKVTSSGKIRSERVYKGVQFRRGFSHMEWVRQKLLYSLLILFACLLLALSAISCGEAGNSPLVVLPQAFALIAMLFLLWYMGCRLFMREVMTLGEYRESAMGFLLCALFAAVLNSLTAAALFCYACLRGFPANALISGLEMAGAAACTWITYRMELRTEYLPAENEPASGETVNE